MQSTKTRQGSKVELEAENKTAGADLPNGFEISPAQQLTESESNQQLSFLLDQLIQNEIDRLPIERAENQQGRGIG